MSRVLLTGAGGFLGRRLLEKLALREEYQVTAVVSGRKAVSFPKNVAVEQADLLGREQVDRLMEHVRPDICIHFAWDQSQSSYRNAAANYQWLGASVSLFSKFLETGGKRFLFAGSSGEYEAQAGGLSEEAKKRPMSLYGRCKKAVSDLLLDTGRSGGVLVQVLRYFTIYGPGETHPFGAIPSAICALLKGETFECRSPKAIRDYIYIDDAVEATMGMLATDYYGAINIGSGIPRSMREVFGEIARQIGCCDAVTYGPEEGSDVILVADNARMREILHTRPAMDFQEGIGKAISYWREQIGEN